MFQNDDFVEVYSQISGEKQMVPRAWLDHPVLGKPFRATPSSTVAAVLAAVGDDKGKAAAALEVENAKGDKARTTLVDALQAVVDAPPTDPSGSPDGSNQADGQKES